MRRPRRTHSPEFKAKVALAAMRGDKTLAELAEQYDLHPIQISEWKNQLAESTGLLFSKGKQPSGVGEEVVKALHAKIGELTIERDFLERGLEQIHGARKREVLDSKWEDFDIERKQWRIPMSKTGRPRYIPLSDGVITLLNSVPKGAGVPWVFANPKTGLPYVSIYNSWDTAREVAGLKDVRMHDLRHSFASFLVNAGRSLYEVQKILGHTQVKTTQRYAHLAQETLLDATNAVAGILGDAIPVKPKPPMLPAA